MTDHYIQTALEAAGKFAASHGQQTFTPRLALFDMDGVLYNSMPYHERAWIDCMAEQGIAMNRQQPYLYEGMRGVETIALMFREQKGVEISEAQARDIYRVKSEKYNAYPVAEQIEGVHLLHEYLHSEHIRIGVVTGSGQPSLIERLTRDFHGLIDPEVIVTANDVKRGKPMPDPYLAGMKKGGRQAYETIVVENAPLGVRAAVSAGCFTIAVNTGPLPESALADEGAHLVLPDMHTARACIQAIVGGLVVWWFSGLVV